MWANQVVDHLNNKMVTLMAGKLLKRLCFSKTLLNLVFHSLPFREH